MKATLTAVALACLALQVQAGRACEEHLPSVTNVAQAMDIAERTRQALDASGADVVLLARAGQDLTRYGLQWSHFGWAYRDSAGWRVVHKLNACGTASADVYRQGLGEFFLDDLWQYRAAYVVPDPATQARLLGLLKDDARVVRLHSADYNMLAYPWSTKYQQSNQWALETLALAEEPAVDSRARAQAWLQFKGYEPSVLQLGPFTRLGARMTRANVAFDDHPNEKRFSDHIETVTVDSVFAWLQRAQLGGVLQVVR